MESQIPDPKAEKAPRLIQVMHNSRPYTDELQAIRISPDGAIGAVVLQSNEILIYRFMDKKKELIPEKVAKKAIMVHKV